MLSALDFGREDETMRRKLTNNLVYKIVAIIFAVMLWLVVVNIDDPDTTRTITGIEVTPLNDDSITSQGLYYTISSGSTAYVKIKGPRSIVDKLDASDFVATADFVQMSMTNAIPLNIELTADNNNYLNRIEIIDKSDTMILELESIQNETYTVEMAYTGTPADGYVVGTQELSNETIEITAPQSKLKTIKSILLSVDTSGKSSDYTVSVKPTLLDQKGEVIEIEDPISLNENSISVKVIMHKIKEVTLNFGTTGEVSTGYQFMELNYTPTTVNIKGLENDIEDINSITIPSSLIDISGATQNIIVNIDISDYLPEGVSLYDDLGKVIAVTAKIEGPEQKEFTIATSKVELRNVPSDLVGSITTNPIIIKLSGNINTLNALDINNITSYVDLTGSLEGSKERTLTINLPSGVSLVSEVKVTVLLTKTSITDTQGTDNN